MATLKALQDKIAKLQAQAEAIAKKESSAVYAKIRELMQKHGLTADDIAAYFRQPATSPKSATAGQSPTSSAAKYVNPKTGATWTGHRRAPAWIADAKNRDRFLASANNPPAAVAEKKPKVGNYARGPQAPKYRDPKSGATWSGRGPAPAWLAAAKDRTKFLIEKPEASPAKSVSAPAKNATKKVAVKKVATKKTTTKSAAVKKSSIVKPPKKADSKPTTVAKKAVPATKKMAAKKTGARTASTKRVAAKKSAVIEAPVPVVEPSVTSSATSE